MMIMKTSQIDKKEAVNAKIMTEDLKLVSLSTKKLSFRNIFSKSHSHSEEIEAERMGREAAEFKNHQDTNLNKLILLRDRFRLNNKLSHKK